MKGLDVFRWLMPAALGAFLSFPVQTVSAGRMGGGGGHGMGGFGSMGVRPGGMPGHGNWGRPAMGSRFFGRNGTSRFAGHAEHQFFFRHNFFVAFDFPAFGFWPWWGWGGWGYPYDYGYPYNPYYPYYDDQSGYDSPYGSQYGPQYWNNLAMSVQFKLARQGYYHGQVDGILGSGSLQAIRRFQSDHGLAVTGRIDPKLLKALGINYKV
jgi:Putative peptidoglycan binding domain